VTASSRATLAAVGGGDVLLLSMRRLADLVAYSMAYEFEDVLSEVAGADRIEADDFPALQRSRRAYKLTRYLSGSRPLAQALAPLPSNVPLQRDYELFLPIFNNTHELYALATIPGWRKRCRYAACFITEVWLHLLPRYLLELLSDFDHIFLGVYHSVAEVGRITGRPCSYLPPAADVLRFTPAPQFPQRTIDVYNIGRRSPVTHRELMRASQAREIFYCYDTVAASGADQKQRTFRIQNASEHRQMLAGMLQRSRYYFANRARVNEPDYTQGRDEISARFYEGAAAGAVMIGEAPRLDCFAQQFDWPDAVIHVPFNSPDITSILARLDADPQRLALIRRSNMVNAALRHDWLYRIRTVFDTFGLPSTAAMRARQQRLQALASLPDDAWPAEAVRGRPPSVSAPPPPTFSVVIPTHNRAASLARAVRSVTAQNFDDYQVIVVDDGSSDSSAAYLATLPPPRHSIFRNERSQGVSAARNRGAAAASGEWIVFLDDDDELRPEALALLQRRIAANPTLDFLWGSRITHEIDSAGRGVARREDDWNGVAATVKGSAFLDLVLKIATNSAFTIRRSVLQAVGGFDERLVRSEDRDLFIALAQQGYTGGAIAQPLIDVEERATSLSRGPGKRGGAEIDLLVIDKHRDYLQRPEHQAFLASYLVAVYVGYLNTGNRDAARRIRRELRQHGAQGLGLARQYLRHAPEFRALKSLVHYDTLRRLANRVARAQPG
jgi:glycosyltransferase involved in cell wall biosynthesis